MLAIDVGTLSIGREGREGDEGSGIATEDNDGADAEAGEYVRDFLEVALSQFLEGRFGRRTTMTNTTETSRDEEHKEGVMLQSMFETFCEGVHWEMRCGHCRCRPPPAAARR